MIVYVDESYPDNQEKIILGALFIGNGEHKRLHAKIRDIKKQSKFIGEIKYSQITNNTKYQIARRMTDAYFESKNSFFSACIIPYSATKLINVDGVDTNQRRVNIYTDSAKKLILGNLPENTISEIYFDEEDRIKKTKLYSRLLKTKSVWGGKISSVISTKSDDESRCVLQVCDLLTGAIKQNLYPTNTEKGKYKKKFSEHVLSSGKVKSCSESNWTKNKKGENHKKFTKFYISYFKIPLRRLKNSKEP